MYRIVTWKKEQTINWKTSNNRIGWNNSMINDWHPTIKGCDRIGLTKISELRGLLSLFHSFHLPWVGQVGPSSIGAKPFRSCNHWKPLADYYWSGSHSIITVPRLDRTAPFATASFIPYLIEYVEPSNLNPSIRRPINFIRK